MNVLRQGLPFRLFALFFFLLSAAVLIIALGSLALHQNAMCELVANRDERAARAAATAIVNSYASGSPLLDGLAVQLPEAKRRSLSIFRRSIWRRPGNLVRLATQSLRTVWERRTPVLTRTQRFRRWSLTPLRSNSYSTSHRSGDDATVVGGIYPRQLVAEIGKRHRTHRRRNWRHGRRSVRDNYLRAQSTTTTPLILATIRGN